jgi:simple sugar transport system substrate-binding protein
MILGGKTLMNGGIPHMLRGGYKDGFVKISPFGAAVSDVAKKDADATIANMKAGSLIVYKGGLKDNTGKTVIPAGKGYPTTAIELESMNWLVEGVVGKTA